MMRESYEYEKKNMPLGRVSSRQQIILFFFAVVPAVLFFFPYFLSGEDSLVLFSHQNFVSDGLPVFHYRGYCSFYPQVMAWLFSFLPYALQPIGYTAFTVFLVFAVLGAAAQYGALRTDRWGHDAALAMPVALLFLVFFFNVIMFVNLTFSFWLGLLLLSLRLSQHLGHGTRMSWAEAFLLSFLASGSPLSVLFIPMVLGIWRQQRHPSLLVLAGALLLWGLALPDWPTSLWQEGGGASGKILQRPEVLGRAFFFPLKLHLIEKPSLIHYLNFCVVGSFFLAPLLLHRAEIALPRKRALWWLWGTVALLMLLMTASRGGKVLLEGRYSLLPQIFLLMLAVEGMAARGSFRFGQRLIIGAIVLCLPLRAVFFILPGAPAGYQAWRGLQTWDQSSLRILPIPTGRIAPDLASGLALLPEPVSTKSCLHAFGNWQGAKAFCGDGFWYLVRTEPFCSTLPCDVPWRLVPRGFSERGAVRQPS